jgi:CTP synthase (UTP-ammonia lyase)
VSQTVRIGLVGDFNPKEPAHFMMNDSLGHTAESLGIPVHYEWVGTETITKENAEARLENFHGIWAAPASPYRSFDGMLAGIEFARTRNRPYLGTCGGFQYTLIEYARNRMGLADADSAENTASSKHIVIAPVSCPVAERKAGAPKLVGALVVRLNPGTRIHEFCGETELHEEYFCNFEMNEEFRSKFEAAGLIANAVGPNGEVRGVELPGHRFFIATLFQPQRSSRPQKPHPLINRYVEAAEQFKAEREKSGVGVTR